MPSSAGPYCYACEYDAGLYTLYQSQSGAGCGEQAGCFTGDHDPDEENRVHCGRFELCLMPYDRACFCTAEECFANAVGNGQITFFPFAASLDPFDATILRLASLSELRPKVTYYLDKQE